MKWGSGVLTESKFGVYIKMMRPGDIHSLTCSLIMSAFHNDIWVCAMCQYVGAQVTDVQKTKMNKMCLSFK